MKLKIIFLFLIQYRLNFSFYYSTNIRCFYQYQVKSTHQIELSCNLISLFGCSVEMKIIKIKLGANYNIYIYIGDENIQFNLIFSKLK